MVTMDPMFTVATDGFGNISIIDNNREEVVATWPVDPNDGDREFLTTVANAFLELRNDRYYQEGP